jgi:hypothetical protein
MAGQVMERAHLDQESALPRARLPLRILTRLFIRRRRRLQIFANHHLWLMIRRLALRALFSALGASVNYLAQFDRGYRRREGTFVCFFLMRASPAHR